MNDYNILVINESGEVKDFNEFLFVPHIVSARTEEEAEEIATANIEAQIDNLKPIWEDNDEKPEYFGFYKAQEIGESEHTEPGFYEI